MNGPTSVIVLAAGQGTRMKSDLPKVVHPLAGVSLLGHALRAARGIDPDHVVAVVRHQRDIVAAEATAVDADVIIADQDEIPGTGRAVQCGLAALAEATGPIEGTVIVTSGDVPLLQADTLRELATLHADSGVDATILTTIVDDPTGYGRIVRDDNAAVQAIVEQRDATDEQRAIQEINAGIYAFDGPFLDAALANVGTDNDQGEVYLTDVIAAAAAGERGAAALILTDEWQARGCNDRIQLAELGAEFNRRINERLMADGVTIVDPAGTWIDIDVAVANDTTILPGSVLKGRTTVGPKCEIGPHTTLVDAEIGAGARVPAAWIENASVAADTMVAPNSVIGRN